MAYDLCVLFALTFRPPDQVISSAAGNVFDCLDLVFTEHHHHRGRHALNLGKVIGNPKLAPLGVAIRLLFLQVLARAGLDLVARVLVEPFNVRNLRYIDVSNFLDGSEAFCHQELGDDLVHVEGFHEHLRAFREFLLTPLRLLLLGHDIDVPARKLRGKSHVLSTPPDGQRKLALGDNNLDAVGILIKHNLGHLSRRKRIDDEARGILVPLDDVNLLALQFVDHRLHARATHTDAGANWVDRRVSGNHCDLGAGAWVASHRLDLDNPVVDLRHFLRKELRHKLRPRTGKEDLRPARLAAHIVNIGAYAVAVAHIFAGNHLITANDALGTA